MGGPPRVPRVRVRGRSPAAGPVPGTGWWAEWGRQVRQGGEGGGGEAMVKPNHPSVGAHLLVTLLYGIG
jgi:hypothetical protein